MCPGPSADCTILPEEGGGRGGEAPAPASRRASRPAKCSLRGGRGRCAAGGWGRGQEDEGGTRGGLILVGGLGEESGGRGGVDRTTTVLFAVLILPVGS